VELSYALNKLCLGLDYNESDLKAAYRRAVKKYHPDRGGSPEEFLVFVECYRFLLDYRTNSKTFTHITIFTPQAVN